MKRFLGIALTAVAVASSVVVAPSQASASCKDQWIEVYRVDLKVAEKTYRIGESADVSAKVTNMTTGTPVQGADVVFGALVDKKYYTYRTSQTNAAGVAVAELKLDRDIMRPGWADLMGRAHVYYEEGSDACAGIMLYGYNERERAFRVKR